MIKKFIFVMIASFVAGNLLVAAKIGALIYAMGIDNIREVMTTGVYSAAIKQDVLTRSAELVNWSLHGGGWWKIGIPLFIIWWGIMRFIKQIMFKPAKKGVQTIEG